MAQGSGLKPLGALSGGSWAWGSEFTSASALEFGGGVQGCTKFW